MSLVLAESPHAARADLGAVATGAGDTEGTVVGVASGKVAHRPAGGVAADPHAHRARTKQLRASVLLSVNPLGTDCQTVGDAMLASMTAASPLSTVGRQVTPGGQQAGPAVADARMPVEWRAGTIVTECARWLHRS
jgi:hypothetical protein